MLDSPARADICKIMSHGSYQGCPFCKFTNKVGGQKNNTGETQDEWKGKVVYSNHVGFSLRTDETFRDVYTQSITNLNTDRNVSTGSHAYRPKYYI